MSVSVKPPESLKQPDSYEAVVLRRIWNQVHKRNEHFMGAFVGREGSGKSYTSLRIANELDPTFNADRVIYDIIDLLKRLKDGSHEKGMAYVLDEAGVELGSRTWQQRSQVLANQVLQIIRDENLILLFTVPSLGDLDSQTERRLGAFFEITHKQHDEFVTGKWKYIDPDRTDVTGKVYHKYPVIDEVNGRPERVKSLAFSVDPLPVEIIEEYEAKKTEFQQRIYEETIAELEGTVDEADDGESFDPFSVAEDIAEDGGLQRVLSIHGGHNKVVLDPDLIQIEYDLSMSKAQKVKKLIERDYDLDLEAHREAVGEVPA